MYRWLDQHGTTEVLTQLACGRCTSPPFDAQKVASLRDNVQEALLSAGLDGRRQATDSPTPVCFRMIAALLELCKDPDHNVFREYAGGVRVNVGRRMPRTPAVFEKKRRWKLSSQEDAGAYLWGLPDWGAQQDNYKSAAALAEAVAAQLEESVREGHAMKMTEDEAKARFGEKLVIASLGAQVKCGEGKDVQVRLLFDGTNGVPVNGLVRDQDRSPAAPDIKRVLREMHQERLQHFGLKVDVKGAHRLVPIHPDDWHLLGCRSGPGMPVYINVAGTFAVASAAYWWGRLAGALVRLIHYVGGWEHRMWLLLVADDLAASAAGPHYRRALLLIILVFEMVGIPLSWKKISGGYTIGWVGYELLLKEFQLGITQNRAAWLDGWYSRMLLDRCVQVGRFQESLGRAAFVCGALEFDRPFLGPLYIFASRHDPSATRPLPLYVVVVMTFLRGRLRERRHYPCGARKVSWSEAWRSDAKAEGEDIGIGGWWPREGPEGKISKADSLWYCVRVTRQELPWAFRDYGQNFRHIAMLEALGVLLS